MEARHEREARQEAEARRRLYGPPEARLTGAGGPGGEQGASREVRTDSRLRGSSKIP